MLPGTSQAEVRWKPLVSCSNCSKTGVSDQIRISTPIVDSIGDLAEMISYQIRQRFIQPPVGWAVNGRGNFQCPDCLKGVK